MVIFVGIAGSGKSTFYKNYLSEKYLWINQDELGTKAKVEKKIREAITFNRNYIIDKMNNKLADRIEYITQAKQNNYKCYIVYFIRDGRANNKRRQKPVSDIVYHSYFKNLTPPSELEGAKVFLLN